MSHSIERELNKIRESLKRFWLSSQEHRFLIQSVGLSSHSDIGKLARTPEAADVLTKKHKDRLRLTNDRSHGWQHSILKTFNKLTLGICHKQLNWPVWSQIFHIVE